MQTGDGLLVRLLPIGTIPLGAFKEICAAARTFGNGIVEITARGSIQVRGLDAASAPRFAAVVGALGIAAQDGVPVHSNPLSGLDPQENLDAGVLAAELRRVLADNKLAARLSPKISVVIDGGGALGLDGLAADIRLRADTIDGAALLRISVGGDALGATDLGFVAALDGAPAAIRLLEAIAVHGRDTRAKDIVVSEGIESFSVAIRDLLLNSALNSRSRGNERKTEIGVHRLRDGLLAFLLGLPFGHSDASSLENLADASAALGAAGMRAAPGRLLIVVGFPREARSAFAADAERLGFIMRGDDPRRHVVACAGAPICASAHMAARAMASRVAADNAAYLRGSFTIHLSGCAKGCAHPAPAPLTIAGTAQGCALIANGAVRDVPFANVQQEEVMRAIAKHLRELTGEAAHV